MPSDELRYMNWQELMKPEKVQVTSNPSYCKFVCEPLERGFGITIGNSLRRIILSSLYGAAIVSVRFDAVMHEFSAIPGVLEDVSEIILNLKQVRFKVNDPEPNIVRIDASGEGLAKNTESRTSVIRLRWPNMSTPGRLVQSQRSDN